MVPLKKRRVRRTWLVLLLGLALLTPVQAQVGTRPGLVIKVHIWGQVNKPGLHTVPSNTDLMELLSLAGGPSDYANLGRIKLIRREEGKEAIFFIDLGEYLDKGDPSSLLILKPGDAVIVPKSSWYYWRTAIGLVSDIAIFVNLALLIRNL